jgi:hypothetical protein
MDFDLKIGYIGSLKWKKKSSNGCFKPHIYFGTNKTLIQSFCYFFERRGKIEATKIDAVQLQLGNV